MLFRRIILSALLVGALAGLVVTAVQHWQVIPIILSAEKFEGEPAAAEAPAAAKEQAGHDHGAHAHSADDWAPADGIERTGYTLLTNILTAFGLALLVLVAMVATQKSTGSSKLSWWHGLLWGAAGYATFYLAPALGLPPEIPGTVAAPLEQRQIWWVAVVVCTAGGLGVLAFGKSPWRWAGLAVIVVPHLVGAPHHAADMFPGQSPEAVAELVKLTKQFFSATAVANAALWLAVGLASVWSVRRIVMPSLDT